MNSPSRLNPSETQITAIELHARLTQGERPVLLDVRTREEWEICRLEGALLVPLDSLAARVNELDPASEIVCYCHVGVRSARAASFLRRAGFARARNLVGGIEGWAAAVDPSMPRY